MVDQWVNMIAWWSGLSLLSRAVLISLQQDNPYHRHREENHAGQPGSASGAFRWADVYVVRIREFLPSPLALSICRLLVTSTLDVNSFNPWISLCIQEPLKMRKSWNRWYPAISQYCDLSRTEGNEKEKDGNVPWDTWCFSLRGSENGSGPLRKTSRTMLPVGGFFRVDPRNIWWVWRDEAPYCCVMS